MSTKTKESDQYDSPWKDILERYFPECLEFFFPQIVSDIDWSKGYEFLDKELQQIAPESIFSERTVDKLVKVWLTPEAVDAEEERLKKGKQKKKKKKEAQEVWLLIHIEVQSQYKAGFTKRTYVYHYRIFDRYGREVVTLVILGDEKGWWRPTEYGYGRWGCEMKLTFPIAKLLDYTDKKEQLEQSNNPFAVVVQAHLHTQETRHDPEKRLDLKWQIIRGLYKRGYSKEEVQALFRFIDWIMKLPDHLSHQLQGRIATYEEEHQMPYVTTIERFGIEKGLQLGVLKKAREAILQVLRVRFKSNELPTTFEEKLEAIKQEAVLDSLLEESLLIDSLSAFATKMDEIAQKLQLNNLPTSQASPNSSQLN